VIVDATPSGVGAQHRALYEAMDTPAVYQGGEDADVAPVSFNGRANYDEAVGADAVRAITGVADRETSVRRTNEALGIGRGLAGLAAGPNVTLRDLPVTIDLAGAPDARSSSVDIKAGVGD